MKKDYILKPIKNHSLQEVDKLRRQKIEDRIGRKFTNQQWENYKIMTLDKPKN